MTGTWGARTLPRLAASGGLATSLLMGAWGTSHCPESKVCFLAEHAGRELTLGSPTRPSASPCRQETAPPAAWKPCLLQLADLPARPAPAAPGHLLGARRTNTCGWEGTSAQKELCLVAPGRPQPAHGALCSWDGP